MNGADFCEFALALHAEIMAKHRPTPDGFEDLIFCAQSDRVTVWDRDTADYGDMAVGLFPADLRARASESDRTEQQPVTPRGDTDEQAPAA